MTLNKPIWHPGLAGLLVRIPLGVYFLLAGLATLHNLNSFVEAVKQLGFLPDKAATLYAVLLPYIEIGTGAMLIVGLWTTVSAILAALMLLSFVAVLGIFPYANNPQIFNKDLLLFAGALSLLSSGAGAFSIDGFKQE